jgi:hypothetical protein
MLSPESRTLLDDIDIFSTMEGSRFRPRGIWFSLSRDINVHYRTTELELWNGDELFRYSYAWIINRLFASLSVCMNNK